MDVTLSANVVGATPEIVGYNCGHFMPGSNTAVWWKYSGVNGARVWSTPSVVEAHPTTGSREDDNALWGDGVSSAAAVSRPPDGVARQSLSTPQANTYINWPLIREPLPKQSDDRREHINLQYAFGTLHELGIDPVVEIHRTNGGYPFGTPPGTAGGLGRPLGAVAALLRAGVLPGEELRRAPLPDVQRAEPRHDDLHAGEYSSGCGSPPTPCRRPSPT